MKTVDFKTQYFKVFDKVSGDVKCCGRDECKILMQMCAEEYPDRIFGSMDTGYMNIAAIREVAKSKGII
ncbi:hypothetical protein J6A31_05705 [bacterium]|nr:hypothetical protein [bacterium]